MKHGRLWESLVARWRSLRILQGVWSAWLETSCWAGGEMTQFSFRQVIEFQRKSKALYLPREWSLFVAGCAHRGRSNQGREGWWGWALTRKHFIRYSPLFLLILCPLRPFFLSSPLFLKFERWRWQCPWAFSYSGLIRSVIQDTDIFSQGMCYSLLAVYKKRVGTASIVDRTKGFRRAPEGHCWSQRHTFY